MIDRATCIIANISQNRVDIGVPQGSDQILFMIYINDLPACNPCARYVLFADDTTVTVSGGSEQEIREQLSLAEISVKDWFTANRLLINTEKTQYMLFCLMDINHGGVPSMKFLVCEYHCQIKIGGACWKNLCETWSIVFLLHNLVGSVSRETVTHVYYALFHNIMSYGILS